MGPASSDASTLRALVEVDTVLALSALTEKDREDLDFGPELGMDWVALSFVQKPEDVE